MKRLIKSKFYAMDIFRSTILKEEIEYTIFKNPNSTEFLEVIGEDTKRSIRGIIQKDGTIYIWKNQIWHDYITKKHELDWDIKFEVVNDVLFLDITYNESKDTLLNSINNIESMFGKSAKNILIIFEKDGTSEMLQEFIDDEILIKSSKLIKTSNVIGFTGLSGKYYECFVNPSEKDWRSIPYSALGWRAMLLKNGDLYLWGSNVLHKDAYGYFNLPRGIHLFIDNSNNIIIYLTPDIDLNYLVDAFKNTTSLYNYVNRNANIEEFNTSIYKAKNNDEYNKIKTIDDLVNINEVDNVQIN